MRKDIAQAITDQIIAAIESGHTSGQWQPPWDTTAGMPSNAFDRRTYNGINTLNLWAARALNGYESNQWATFKRWKTEGYRLREAKGHGVHVVYWRWLDRKNEAGEVVDQFPLLRSFHVFNADLAANAETGEPFTDATTPTAAGDPVAEGWEAASEIINSSGADIMHGQDRAAYMKTADRIVMPSINAFNTVDDYYSTAFHELAHWTGHPSRLNRKLGSRFGSAAYAMEELIAELSAAFTCAHVRMSAKPRTDHAQYLETWLKVLKDDKNAIMKASSQAFKATEYLVNSHQAQTRAEAA